MEQPYRVPLTLEPQPEGGYIVTSSVLPELITEGDTVAQALDNARDAFAAVLEIYEDEGRPLPDAVRRERPDQTIKANQLLIPA